MCSQNVAVNKRTGFALADARYVYVCSYVSQGTFPCDVAKGTQGGTRYRPVKWTFGISNEVFNVDKFSAAHKYELTVENVAEAPNDLHGGDVTKLNDLRTSLSSSGLKVRGCYPDCVVCVCRARVCVSCDMCRHVVS